MRGIEKRAREYEAEKQKEFKTRWSFFALQAAALCGIAAVVFLFFNGFSWSAVFHVAAVFLYGGALFFRDVFRWSWRAAAAFGCAVFSGFFLFDRTWLFEPIRSRADAWFWLQVHEGALAPLPWAPWPQEVAVAWVKIGSLFQQPLSAAYLSFFSALGWIGAAAVAFSTGKPSFFRWTWSVLLAAGLGAAPVFREAAVTLSGNTLLWAGWLALFFLSVDDRRREIREFSDAVWFLSAAVHPFLWGALGAWRWILSGVFPIRGGSLRAAGVGLSPYFWFLWSPKNALGSFGETVGKASEKIFFLVGTWWHTQKEAFLAAPKEFGVLFAGMLVLAFGSLFLQRYRRLAVAFTAVLGFFFLGGKVLSLAAFFSAAKILWPTPHALFSSLYAGLRWIPPAAVLFLAAGAPWKTIVEKTPAAPFYFRHAWNFLALAEEKSILVFEDTEEAVAVRAVQSWSRYRQSVPILEKNKLGSRLYLEKMFRTYPEVLVSTYATDPNVVFWSIVRSNIRRRPLEWAAPDRKLSKEDEGEWVFLPRVLFFRIQESPPPREPEDVFSALDVTFFWSPEFQKSPLREAIRRRYLQGFLDRGAFFERLEKYDRAVHVYEGVLGMDPGNVEARKRLKRLFEEKKFLEAARLELEEVLVEAPKLLDKLWVEADHARKADFLQWLGKLEEIAKWNERLADAQFRLAKIYEKTGRAEEARKLLEESAKRAPKRREVHLLLGRMLYQNGRFDRALEVFRHVLRIEPDNKEAQEYLWKILNERPSP